MGLGEVTFAFAALVALLVKRNPIFCVGVIFTFWAVHFGSSLLDLKEDNIIFYIILAVPKIPQTLEDFLRT